MSQQEDTKFATPKSAASYKDWSAKQRNYTKPAEGNLKSTLTELQYSVTQTDDTEKPFKNKYWDNDKEGIYVDIVSGEPLFSSKDKYVSGTGWPSFTRPISDDAMLAREDRLLVLVRTELRSKMANSHLGHLFDDGPEPTGKRYCINSASLRFVPKTDLQKEGYDDFLSLFEKDEL